MIMYELVEKFSLAIAEGRHEFAPEYVAVVFEMDNLPLPEIIINPISNAREKMNYYKGVYNLDGTHKKGAPVKIIAVFKGINLESIETQFLKFMEEREDETEKHES
jgi:hypothetical protein